MNCIATRGGPVHVRKLKASMSASMVECPDCPGRDLGGGGLACAKIRSCTQRRWKGVGGKNEKDGDGGEGDGRVYVDCCAVQM